MSGEVHQRKPVAGEKRLIARLEFDHGFSVSLHEASLPLTIGRSVDCDICIPLPNVSRQHCELDLIGGELCLKDTSTNGTTIDNRSIKQTSVPIKARTSFIMANEVMLTVTPFVGAHSNNEGPIPIGRRQGERRQEDRRQKVVTVNFERRRSDGRRVKDRRTASRS